jgi:bisphosphoglycerate-independent phosphoglycerate mutase (AlkP superfamily)
MIIALRTYMRSMDVYLNDAHWFSWHPELSHENIEKLSADDLIKLLSEKVADKKLSIELLENPTAIHNRITHEIDEEEKVLKNYIQILQLMGMFGAQRLTYAQRVYERLPVLKKSVKHLGKTRSKSVSERYYEYEKEPCELF